MLDIKLLREHPQIVKENIKRKGQLQKLPLVEAVLKKDTAWRKLKAEGDTLRAERNKISKEINQTIKTGKKPDMLLKKAKLIPKKIEESEAQAAALEEEINRVLSQLPNIIAPNVPQGRDANDNKEIKKWGKLPEFNFTPKNHVELVEALDIGDFDSSAKVAGNGFYYLKGDLALLNQALIRFTLDFLTKQNFIYIEPPLMLHAKEIYASMDKEAIEQSVYSIKDQDLHLIGTAEQSLLAMHAQKTFTPAQLPKRYCAYSMCFRKEVGSHGINEKGLWRTHQFNKVEQFVFCLPQDSEKIYDELLQNSESILQALALPYRVLEICTGDLADWKFRSADLEVWRPTTKNYGEVMSLSNCTDYQARKLNIKFLDKQSNKHIVHTLNDTAMATSRIMVAILENFQQKDSSIKIPDVLIPYMGKKVIRA